MPLSTCGSCGHEFDRASGLSHDLFPTPGDVTLCITCGTVHRFDHRLVAVLMSGEEIVLLDPVVAGEVRRIQDAIAMLASRRAAHAAARPESQAGEVGR